MLADSTDVSTDQLLHAKHQALMAAGVAEVPAKLLAFLRWRTLQVAGPLREMAQDENHRPGGSGSRPRRRGTATSSWGCARRAGSHERLARRTDGGPKGRAERARQNAVANIDIMLRLVQQSQDLFAE